jgi:hypothetical protein
MDYFRNWLRAWAVPLRARTTRTVLKTDFRALR